MPALRAAAPRWRRAARCRSRRAAHRRLRAASRTRYAVLRALAPRTALYAARRTAAATPRANTRQRMAITRRAAPPAAHTGAALRAARRSVTALCLQRVKPTYHRSSRHRRRASENVATSVTPVHSYGVEQIAISRRIKQPAAAHCSARRRIPLRSLERLLASLPTLPFATLRGRLIALSVPGDQNNITTATRADIATSPSRCRHR